MYLPRLFTRSKTIYLTFHTQRIIQMRSFMLILGLSLGLWACPDDTGSKDQSSEGGTATAGEEGGNSLTGGDTVGGTNTNTQCFDDSECADDAYCFIDEANFYQGSCEPGCRNDDSCSDGDVCNLETRVCESIPCEDDNACVNSQYCNDNGECTDGCRLGDCGDTDEQGRILICDTDTRECIATSACCVPGDDADVCETYTEMQCADAGGQLLTQSLLCDDNPCTDRCETDVNCSDLDDTGVTFYCNEDQRCDEGCREGTCGEDRCNLETHRCEERRCADNSECLEGEYCEPSISVCLPGCGEDTDCGEGFSCYQNECIELCDIDDPSSCGEGSYCDMQTCRPFCATHDDCGEAEACDPTTFKCILGACRNDEALGDLNGEPNNSPDNASELLLLPIANQAGKFVASAEGRVLCGADVDLYLIRLGNGDRMRISLNVENNRELNLVIFASDDLNTQIDSTSIDPGFFEYPAEGSEGLPADQDFIIQVSGNLEEVERIVYQVNVQVAGRQDSCFSDVREGDDGDNTYQTATPLVADGISIYNDGTICSEDEDWFSLPLAVDDGLTIRMTTALEAEPLRFDLRRENELASINGNNNAYLSVTFENSIEDLDQNIRVYELVVDSNSGTFLQDNWFITVESNNGNGVASYRLQVEHQAVGGVCINDAYDNDEINNNSVTNGVDIVSTYDLLTDDLGLIAQGRDNRIQDGIICAGDVDYYCFNATVNDTLEAWISSDTVRGNLTISFVNEQGGSVGTEARHTGVIEDPDIASAFITTEGRYCAVVNGLANAQGAYELVVRRTVAMGGFCANDEVDGRNDSADNATPLIDISPLQNGERFEQRNGLMCEAVQDNADWYSFNVTEDNSRVCITLEAFNHDQADLDIELFEPPSLDTPACAQDSACDGSQVCIAGHCQIDAARSTFEYDFEMLGVSRVNTDIGEHYLRVARGAAGNPMSYDLRVTVTSESDTCAEDYREAGDLNDDAGVNVNSDSRATILGSGHIGFCDAWLCKRANNEIDEDWYQITVPANEDRTVIIEFESESDGALSLYYFRGNNDDFVLQVSDVPNFNYQCLNIRGGAEEIQTEIGVASSNLFFVPDGDDKRIDYSLRVVPVNLDLQPDGACPLFGANNIPSCPEGFDDPFADTCWPTVTVEVE
jgi:hypothetical protein